MREFTKRRNGTLRKGLMFNFPAGSGCNKLWEITSLGQAPKGLQSCYRLNLRGNSTCGKLATNSRRNVLKSSPWARQFFRQSAIPARASFRFIVALLMIGRAQKPTPKTNPNVT